MMKRLFLAIMVLSLTPVIGMGRTFIVSNQQQFDSLGDSILQQLRSNDRNIDVDIRAKQLTFRNNHLQLKSLRYPQASITINGNGVRLIPEGRTTKASKCLDCSYTRRNRYFNPWTKFYQLSDTIETVNKEQGIYRLSNISHTKPTEDNLYLQVTSWFRAPLAKITQIDKNWIYFQVEDTRVDVNGDYNYTKHQIYPRYRILGLSKKKVYECTASTFMEINRCNLKTVHISGIEFIGSAAGGNLINILNSHADHFLIEDNTFDAIGGHVLYEIGSSNVWFRNNSVCNFRENGVRSETGSEGAIIEGNSFVNGTAGITNGFCIMMRSNNFIVKNNTIKDFHYGGIGAGIWYGTKVDTQCAGIIENNTLTYTKSFVRNYRQHTLMDSGAIYTWTRCDGVSIIGNTITNYIGMKDNRGIFCDDGTRNVSVINNRIEKTHNSYDIDLRWCNDVKQQVPDHNTGNSVHDNQTTGTIRFHQSDPSITR